MITSVDEVCNTILKSPKPLIFLDTCTILNVINALHLMSIPEKYIEHANQLIGLQKKGLIWLTTSENVTEEYSDNIDQVSKTAEKSISDITRHVKVMQSFANTLTSTSNVATEFSSYRLHSHAKSVADNLLNVCSIVKRKPDYSVRAMARVRKNLAPARQGGGEAKDCEIIECFYDLANSLRNRNFKSPIIFLTSNTKDYGKTKELKPPIDTEFTAIKAEYANYIDHALHLCGIS